MKRFASIWLPRFRIDRLRRDKPGQVPADKPFALVERGAHGVRIAAVNGLAARQGIRPGQALADARAIRPDLATAPAAPAREAAVLGRLALWLGRYGSSRNIEGCDGLWVDITGVAHLFGGEAGLARDCWQRLQAAGFAARVAIADTRAGAFALARHGEGAPARTAREAWAGAVAIVPRGRMREALAELPVEGLQLSGDLAGTLRRLGLRRIGQLYGLPRAALERRFRGGGGSAARPAKGARQRQEGWAEALVMRLDQALGDLGEPAVGLSDPPAFRVKACHAEPLVSDAGIMAGLVELAAALCGQLEAQMVGARRFRFLIFRADGDVAQIDVRTSRPVAGAGHILELFRLRLERIDAGLGIDALVLEAFECEGLEMVQAGLGHGHDGAASQVAAGGAAMAALGDRLANRLGERAVYRLGARDGHIPEQAQMHVPVLGCGRALPAVPAPIAARPLFLIDPAERVDVIAEVPDGPPARFTWRRVTRRVMKAEGPERIAPEWWLQLGGGPGGAEERRGDGTIAVADTRGQTRDYWRVEDGHGAQYWLYRAGLYGAETGGGGELPAWFLQGVF